MCRECLYKLCEFVIVVLFYFLFPLQVCLGVFCYLEFYVSAFCFRLSLFSHFFEYFLRHCFCLSAG